MEGWIFLTPSTLALKHQQKLNPKMLSAQVACCLYLITLLVNESINKKSVNPDQTAPT